MMRVFTLWSAAVGLAVFVLACGRDQSREAAMQRDTSSAPATVPAPTPDTTAPVLPDTTPAAATTDTAPARPAAPSTALAQKPGARPSPAPMPTPVPKPDTGKVKPNIDPGRVAPAPTVPAPAQQAAGQDTTQPSPLRDPYHQAPRDTVSQAVYNGWKQFNLNCARCHGEDVLGTTIAPHLTESLQPSGPINTKELFIQTVCHGRPEKGMPAWCSLGLDTAVIEQIYSYVKGRSDGTVHPGRPAVRR